MIKMPCGLPGSGKSYDTVVNCFLPVLKTGRTIWTNLDGLDFEYISIITGIAQSQILEQVRCLNHEEVKLFYRTAWHRYNYKENPTKYEQEGITWLMYVESNKVDLDLWLPDNAYVIIDETQKYWGVKDYAKIPKEFDDFLSMHRHYGADIVFISQRPARVYKEIQRLAEYIWMFEKMSRLGLSSRYKAAVRYSDDRRSFKRVIRKYDKKYFPCYKSYAGAEIQEIKTEGARLFATWQIAAAALFVLTFGYKFANMRWFKGVQPNEVHASMIETTVETNNKVRVGGKDAVISNNSSPKNRKIRKKVSHINKKRIKKKSAKKDSQTMEKRNVVINGLGWSGRELVIYLDDRVLTFKKLGELVGGEIFRDKDQIIIKGKRYSFGDSLEIQELT